VIHDREGLGALLLRISPATIDRVLSEDRIASQTGRRRRAGMSSAIRRDVPVHTFNDWVNPAPGFVEADFVAHGGTSVAGSFIQTLVLTDVATGWTECVPVITRSAPLVIEAIRSAMALFPFPLKGIDFDNDSAFMNEDVVPWCRATGLIVTRSRAYKKNDQAWVEQKNGAIVRRLVGYGRLEGIDTLRCLNRLYAASRLHVNLCQPSFKLKSKKRIGARVQKTWDDPQAPAARLLARADVCSTVREKLAALGLSAEMVVSATETDVDCFKPLTAGLEKIIGAANERPERVLMIGDRDERDGECARRAGARYLIKVKTDPHSPEEVQHFGELVAALGRA
jgi:hypothetical protein